MNKHAISLAALAVAMFGASAAQAADLPIYGELKSGISFQSLDNVTNTTDVANPAPVATTSQGNTVGAFGAAAGLNFAKWGAPVRAEVEYDYRTDFGYNPNPNFTNAGIPTKSTNTLNTQTVLFNGYYDIDTGTKFTPFVGGGLGFAINDVSGTGSLPNGALSSNYSSSNTSFAWALGGGVNYAIDTHWSIDASYRYVGLGKADFGNSSASMSGNVSSNEILAGLRYQL
ncbi:MAG: outer membrane beta-barrel protein [Alphaproteobacteria bacterium]